MPYPTILSWELLFIYEEHGVDFLLCEENCGYSACGVKLHTRVQQYDLVS